MQKPGFWPGRESGTVSNPIESPSKNHHRPHRSSHPNSRRDAQVPKEAYRYSRPTTRRRTDSDKILATCDAGTRCILAIGD